MRRLVAVVVALSALSVSAALAQTTAQLCAIARQHGDTQFLRQHCAALPQVRQHATSRQVRTVATPLAVELAFWDSIRASNNPADFQAYLNKYPDGQFVELARNHLSVAPTESVTAPDAFASGWTAYQAGDFGRALTWYQRAAAQGYAAAQSNIGVLYIHGWGVPLDYAQAKSWFEKAAAQGNADAEVDLGSLYVHGVGVTRDYAEAMTWYQKAAAQGNGDAEDNIGAMYQNGWGVTLDYGQAMTWFEKAAAEGNATAEYVLGLMFSRGEGATKDDDQARAWMQKAAAAGNAGAKSWLAQH